MDKYTLLRFCHPWYYDTVNNHYNTAIATFPWSLLAPESSFHNVQNGGKEEHEGDEYKQLVRELPLSVLGEQAAGVLDVAAHGLELLVGVRDHLRGGLCEHNIRVRVI